MKRPKSVVPLFNPSGYSSNSGMSYVLGFGFLLLVALLIFHAGRDGGEDDQRVIEAIENHGFSEVKIQNESWAAEWKGCSSSDDVAYDFVAKNPAGRQVSMVACAGFYMKGVTIRSR